MIHSKTRWSLAGSSVSVVDECHTDSVAFVSAISVIATALVCLITLTRWGRGLGSDFYGWLRKRRKRTTPARVYSSFDLYRPRSSRGVSSSASVAMPDVYPDAVAHGAYAEARLARYRREGLRTITRRQRKES